MSTDFVSIHNKYTIWYIERMIAESNARYSTIVLVGAAAICPLAFLAVQNKRKNNKGHGSWKDYASNVGHYLIQPLCKTTKSSNKSSNPITQGGYESLIGNTPLLYLPHLSSLIPNNVKIYVKMENMNPGGTGKDRAAKSMILDAEQKGDLPHPLGFVIDKRGGIVEQRDGSEHPESENNKVESTCDNSNIPQNIQSAIETALHNTQTHGIIIEGTSGSTGISLASISSSRGHGVIVVMPDDQSLQKREFLERLGCGVVVVKNCSISNPGHYVNVARRIWEWVQIERRYDDWYWKHIITAKKSGDNEHVNSNCTRLIKAAFMNQFENLANLHSHYLSTGPEIYEQLNGEVDAFVMSAGTGGTIVGVGGYLKDRWWLDHGRKLKPQRARPKIVLVDPPGSSLYNKVKFGVAYAPQMSEQRLRRHRYDTLAEGIGLDRITANFGLGCIDIGWKQDGISFKTKIDTTQSHPGGHLIEKSKVIDDAISITDQQAVYMAHYLLRHEGLFVGSSTAMNIVGALMLAQTMPPGSNLVTVVCDGGQRHTSRFWNKDFIKEWGLTWPTEEMNILRVLGVTRKCDGTVS